MPGHPGRAPPRLGRLGSEEALEVLAELFVRHGPPEHIRSDNGPEFAATAVRKWLGRRGVGTLFIEPGSPWENGYRESLNGKLRDELLDREVVHSLREAQVLVEAWRRHSDTARPHSALGYRPPAPEAIPGPAWIPPRSAAGQAAGVVYHRRCAWTDQAGQVIRNASFGISGTLQRRDIRNRALS